MEDRINELWLEVVDHDVCSNAEFLIQAHKMNDKNRFDEFENTVMILSDTGNLDGLSEVMFMEV